MLRKVTAEEAPSICNIYNKLHVNSKAEAVAKVLSPRR